MLSSLLHLSEAPSSNHADNCSNYRASDMTDLHIVGQNPYDLATTKDWRCFHCDEVFHTEMEARNHFGGTQDAEPACRIKVAGEFALLTALRNAEIELARYRREDSDIIRAMHSMQADHAQALRREEEKGYARGLKDGQATASPSRTIE